MVSPRQGEIWWAEPEGGRRPVLVITRSDAIDVLTTVLVAPVTRTVRGIPTEITLGPSNGLDVECVATFDNVQPIRRSLLTERVGQLDATQSNEICRALNNTVDC